MDLTIFLAKLWGPVVFAVGVGIFLSPSFYIKVYRDLEKDSLAVLLFGMIGMAAGILQVSSHNVWETFPEIVVSVLGWGMFFKGMLFVMAPGIVDLAGNFWVKRSMVPVAGLLTLVIGGYLSWLGYLA